MGNKCYFMVNVPLTVDGWNLAWQTCAKYGSKLAHIHTSMEFESITSYVMVCVMS